MLSDKKPIKILLVTRPIAPPWDEASKNFAWNLAQNLSDFNFGILSTKNSKESNSRLFFHNIYSSVKWDLTQKINLAKFLASRSMADYDIIHLLFTPTLLNSFLLKKLLANKFRQPRKKIPVLQTIATLREDLYSASQVRRLIWGDFIVTYSQKAKSTLEKLGFQNIKQIYPGLDLELYKKSPKDQDLMNRLNLNSEDFVVVYPGEYARLGATFDILQVIVQHAETLKNRKIKIIFACRTKNKEDQKIKELVQKKLSDKNLLSLARFPDTFVTMEKVFNLAEVVIFPVREMRGKFDVPLAVIEAMACAKPTILSDLPQLAEFSNNQVSVIIKSSNSSNLIEAITNLCDDKELRQTLGQKAADYAAQNFDIRQIAKQYAQVYRLLIEKIA